MFSICTTVLLTFAAQAVLASPINVRTAYAIKESHHVPPKWQSIGKPPLDHKLHLQIGLKQDRFDELERHLLETSDPGHPRYGQHLTAEEVHELVKPSDTTLDFVHEWLLLNGVNNFEYSPAKDWINIYVDLDIAERLLDTEYSVFKHVDGTHVVRTSKWSLPLHLHDLIDTIQPTTSFMRTKGQISDFVQSEDNSWTPPNYKPPTNETIAKVCNLASVTLECFNTLYGTLGYKQRVPGINKIGFNNYLNQTPIRPDIYQFLKKYNPPSADSANKFKSIVIADGPDALSRPVTPAEANGPDRWREANLDAQTILGMTYPQPVYSYSTGGSPPFNPDLSTPTDTNEPYLVWVTYVAGQKAVPQVISTSYGDDEQTVPESYAKRVCQEFASLGARGISLLVSSGDRGLGAQDGTLCYTNDGKNSSTLLPAFPASCPYVTSVGATMQFEPEVPVFRLPGLGPDGKNHSFYVSGSGFSNYFKRPNYQNGVVDKYVKSLPEGLYDGLYNSGGRGYPDIAAQGLYFAFVFNLTESTISGTSASCPLMASIISLVNDALISSGKPTLGFLNPWLYKKGYKGFTDVVSGRQDSCGVEGFPATKGWDPLSGFGTPVFSKILKLAGVPHKH